MGKVTAGGGTRMRRPRWTLQWFMVVVVFAAVLLWGGPGFGEIGRRWGNCRRIAGKNAASATANAFMASGLESRGQFVQAMRYRSMADRFADKARTYRRALWVPWEFWRLGN